jgi:integrase
MLAVLLGCGLRRSELINLEFDHLQRREDHWAIVDLVGKGTHISNGADAGLGETDARRMVGRS